MPFLLAGHPQQHHSQLAGWRFPFDSIVRPDDVHLRRHHSRWDICALYEHKAQIAQRVFAAHRYVDRRVLEIGVRACYSAEAFCAASATSYHGIDADTHMWGGVPGWVEPAFDALRDRWPNMDLSLNVADSHSAPAIREAGERGPFALIHVDGDHSFGGTLCDLEAYAPMLTSSGLILVDGVHWDETVWKAVAAFACRNREWVLRLVPTRRFGDDALLTKGEFAELGTVPSHASIFHRVGRYQRTLMRVAGSFVRSLQPSATVARTPHPISTTRMRVSVVGSRPVQDGPHGQ